MLSTASTMHAGCPLWGRLRRNAATTIAALSPTRDVVVEASAIMPEGTGGTRWVSNQRNGLYSARDEASVDWGAVLLKADANAFAADGTTTSSSAAAGVAAPVSGIGNPTASSIVNKKMLSEEAPAGCGSATTEAGTRNPAKRLSCGKHQNDCIVVARGPPPHHAVTWTMLRMRARTVGSSEAHTTPQQSAYEGIKSRRRSRSNKIAP